MEDLSRRSFLSLGALAAGAMAATAVGCSPAEEKPAEQPMQEAAPAIEVSSLTGWAGTPAEILALGGSTMPLEDLNAYRKAYVDSQTDYVCEDGTVIPAIFVKVRALIHTYGQGAGNTPGDTSFGGIMDIFSEEDAQTYLDMPWGVAFTASELHACTGRSIEECKEYCERIADGGFLCRYETCNGTMYHQVAAFQGALEYSLRRLIEDGWSIGIAGSDSSDDRRNSGTPTFYAVPCDRSVTVDGTVLPFDDLEAIIKSKNALAIAPCACRTMGLAASGSDFPSFDDFATGNFEDYMSPVVEGAGSAARVETCLMMGEEAEYWISIGQARPITQEQAISYMKRSCEDGFILESAFGKNSETVCSCHSSSCHILAGWKAIGDPDCQGFQQISHYNLEHDFEACLKCGICANRCPMGVITMDGEDGAPVVNGMCFRCGQCCYVCPQEARKLVQRPDEEILELPQGFLEDNNMKAAYRFEMGLIS